MELAQSWRLTRRELQIWKGKIMNLKQKWDLQQTSHLLALHGEDGVHGEPAPQAACNPEKELAASHQKMWKRKSVLQVLVINHLPVNHLPINHLLEDIVLRLPVQVDVERLLR